MDIRKHTDNFIKVLLNPILGWKKTNFSDVSFKNVIFPYLSGILIICFFSRIIGKSLSYLSISSIQYIVFYALLSLIVDYIFFVSLVLSINVLLPYFDTKSDKDKIAVLMLLSLMPFYASVVILNIFPSLYFLVIIAIYTFFILYWGTMNFLKIDKERQIIFYALTCLITIGIYLILHFVIIYPFFEYYI